MDLASCEPPFTALIDPALSQAQVLTCHASTPTPSARSRRAKKGSNHPAGEQCIMRTLVEVRFHKMWPRRPRGSRCSPCCRYKLDSPAKCPGRGVGSMANRAERPDRQRQGAHGYKRNTGRVGPLAVRVWRASQSRCDLIPPFILLARACMSGLNGVLVNRQ